MAQRGMPPDRSGVDPRGVPPRRGWLRGEGGGGGGNLDMSSAYDWLVAGYPTEVPARDGHPPTISCAQVTFFMWLVSALAPHAV